MPSARSLVAWQRFAAAVALLLLPAWADAQTIFTVTDQTSLANAIASAVAGDTIVFQNNITLTSNLAAIQTNVTIDGNGFALSGNNQFQGFAFASPFAGTAIPISVTVQNLTIQNTVAAGGAGTDGAGGGGGGAGLGGALYVGNLVTLTVSNVSLLSNSAIGGAGGSANSSLNGGNGGGALGGAGGTSPNVLAGSAGGYAGGGGGAAIAFVTAGNGPGGQGGFGGGAGGSTDGSGVGSLFGGGGNASSTGGGGGAGLGGAIFVQSGGAINITGAFNVNGNSVTGGAGGTGAQAGSAFGSGLFLDGYGTLAVNTASTVTIVNDIADQLGNGGGGGSWGVSKDGTGTLVLAGNNTYSGGTNVFGGTVSVSSDANLGTTFGTVSLYDGTTLAITKSATFAHDMSLGGNATVRPSAGQTATWNGVIFNSDFPGTLTVNGGGTLVLTNPKNDYTGGTVVIGGSTVRVNDDAELGASGGVTLGDATTTGTLNIVTNRAFTSARSFTLGAAGGIIDTSSPVTASITGPIGGAGSLTKNGAGTLILGDGATANLNTYAGPTIVNAGRLVANGYAVFGAAPAMTVASGATVDLNGFDQSFDTLSGSGNFFLNNAAASIGYLNGTSAFGGAISGTGSLVKVGNGTFTLSGSNTFTGGLFVDQGTLVAGSDSNLGQGSVFLSNRSGQATLALAGSNTFFTPLVLAGIPFVNVGGGNVATWNGQVTGAAGTLNVTGGGTFVLGNSANTYSGGTNVIGGSTLQISADGALGATGTPVGLGNSSSSGALAINAGSFVTSRPITFGAGGGTINTLGGTNATLTGALTGPGGLTKTGSGTLMLAGATSYGGATTVLDGTLRAGAVNVFGTTLSIGSGGNVDLNGYNQSIGALAGSGAVNLGGGAALTLGATGASSTYGGSLVGTGSLVKAGGGTLALLGANSYSGGTTVSGGTLVGTTASVQGNIINNASVVFDQATDGTYAGSMSGSGSLTKAGTGNLFLTGSSTYTGGTFIAAGTLTGSSSNLYGQILNNGTLVFNQTSDGAFNGAIFGSGSVTKSGGGLLTISGANPFSGALNINAGTVALNGGFGGDVNVGRFGTLQGGGTIGGSLNVAGSLFVAAPGSTSATFNAMSYGLKPEQALLAPSLIVNGNFTTTPGSLLNFTVTPNGAPPIQVNGLANLNGSSVNVTVNDPAPPRYATYIGLISGGVTSNSVTASSPNSGIVPVLKFDPRYMYVTVLNENLPLAGVTTNGNATSVAGAIDRIKAGATGDLAGVIAELTALTDPQLNTALQQVAGQVHATELRLTIDDSRGMTDLVRDMLSSVEDDQFEEPIVIGRQSVRWWFDFTGEHASFSPAGVDNATANLGGGAGGFDFNPWKRFTLGAGGSFSHGALSMLDLGGSSDLNAPRAFGYAGVRLGPFGINFGGSAAHTSYTTQRPIAFVALAPTVSGDQPLTGGVNRQAQSDQTGVTRDAWTEFKDTLKVKTYTIDWKLGWRTASYDRNQFVETGAEALSLLGLPQTLTTKEGDFNVNVFRRKGKYRPRVMVMYRRELGDSATDAPMQLGNIPAGNYVVDGVPIARDQFHGIAGLTIRTGLGVEYAIEYETFRAADESHQGVHLRVRFK